MTWTSSVKREFNAAFNETDNQTSQPPSSSSQKSKKQKTTIREAAQVDAVITTPGLQAGRMLANLLKTPKTSTVRTISMESDLGSLPNNHPLTGLGSVDNQLSHMTAAHSSTNEAKRSASLS